MLVQSLILIKWAIFSFVSRSHQSKHLTYSKLGLRSETGTGSGYGIQQLAKRRSKTRIASNNEPNDPFEIPILGPLLDIQKPVIVGDSIWLHPTPLQWQAVEASVSAQHGGTIRNWKSGTVSEVDEVETIHLATISKSPLVAILHRGGTEYATLAAIEGLVTKTEGPIDTNDAESFRESLANLCSPYYSDRSKIRLIAVGRAKVSHFSTKFLTDGDSFNDQNYKKHEVEGTESTKSEPSPLLVARMELLFDSNEEGKKPSSPVHALNRLSTFAQRIRFLHGDRQRIVKGLQAAQSRLEMAMNEWEDWDGIGSINNNVFERSSPEKQTESTSSNEQDVLDRFLKHYNADESTPLAPSHPVLLSPRAARCIDLDNYGLGSRSSAFASLNSASTVLAESLRNYFSPSRIESEEFEYEVFSWSALQSLQPYLTSEEIDEALFKCTCTCSRLELIYQAMIRHKVDLDELAQAKITELRNCGEECDLF